MDNQASNDEDKSLNLFLEQPFGDYSSNVEIDANTVSSFRQIIYSFYRERGREFPWRKTENPYEVLVSEIMLQQTQTGRVLSKYVEFIARWPDIAALSRASLADVYEVWKGLGYNRRAKALIDIAGQVVERHGGVIPAVERELRQLPMVGQSTAAAVLAFAYEIPVVYLETNIRRALLYFFFEGCSKVQDREVFTIARSVLDSGNPRQWNYALTDYGVFLRAILPNTNRRSAHYARQGPFENSNRQIRGRILRRLSEHGPGSVAEIRDALAHRAGRIEHCLEQLKHDGMLVCENGRYRIPD